MEVNFIITVYDKEEFLPATKDFIKKFTKIQPKIFVVYCGPNKVEANLKLPDPGEPAREIFMTLWGYKKLSEDSVVPRYVKMTGNTWLMDEDVIINIFNEMENRKAAFGGNHWHFNLEGSLSADIFFADTRFGNVFKAIDAKPKDFEVVLFDTLRKIKSTPYIIEGRDPVYYNNLHECKTLKWAMHSNIGKNFECFQEWVKK